MKPAFEVKSARLDALAVQLNHADAAAVAALLAERAAQYRELNMPLLLDMQAFKAPGEVDLAAVCAAFAENGLRLCALRHDNASLWEEAAQQAALAFDLAAKNTVEPPAGHSIDNDNPDSSPTETVETATLPAARPTVLVSSPIRTGQQVYAEQADLIVTGMVSEGAEIIADGHIHVYGVMRGRALAGADGRRDARIFIQCMQAELVSVAGIYRNFEQDLPPHLHKHPVQIYLQEDRLVISAVDGR